ncbi:ANTAR domain-containing protein [Frankia sp. AgPm24]|uniref:ANTAR domain-containing protein n=1 Tax=Frankia sp. AgPm24 TaxID=631128 RepID=UPI0027E33461|nr:ANTAR domain-containing protein [Frankia sp. AgPm24]
MSSAPSEQAWSTVDAALRAVHARGQMETACFVVVSATTVGYLRLAGSFAGLEVGTHYPRADSVIARMLDGAPAAASGVGPGHPAADTAEHRLLGVRSYLATPVLRPDGRLLGVLVSLDHGEVPVTTENRAQVRGIADELAASGHVPVSVGSASDADGPVAAMSAAATDLSDAVAVAPTGDPAESGAPTRVSLTTDLPPGSVAPPTGVPRTDVPPTDTPPADVPQPHADVPHTEAPPVDAPQPHTDVPQAERTHAEATAGGGPAVGVPSGAGTATSAGRGAPVAGAAHPRPGRMPTPQTIARAVRPGGPARTTPPRPVQPAAAAGSAGSSSAGRGTNAAATAAATTAAARRPGADMRLRRTSAGWVVEGPGPEVRPVGDLLSAMVLADLLAEDLAPPGRPRRAERDLGEIEQLRLSVVQLEHALASRVIVEQAIGVLAERNQIRPREAFERLRRTARGMGRRVHDLARQVVDSVGDPRVALPGELGGRGNAGGPGSPGDPGGPGGTSGSGGTSGPSGTGGPGGTGSGGPGAPAGGPGGVSGGTPAAGPAGAATSRGPDRAVSGGSAGVTGGSGAAGVAPRPAPPRSPSERH